VRARLLLVAALRALVAPLDRASTAGPAARLVAASHVEPQLVPVAGPMMVPMAIGLATARPLMIGLIDVIPRTLPCPDAVLDLVVLALVGQVSVRTVVERAGRARVAVRVVSARMGLGLVAGLASVRTARELVAGLASVRTGLVRAGRVLALVVVVSVRTALVLVAGLASVRTGLVRVGRVRARVLAESVRMVPLATVSASTVRIVGEVIVLIVRVSQAGPLTAVRRVGPVGAQRAARVVVRLVEHVVVSVAIRARRDSVAPTAAAHVRTTAAIVPLASPPGGLPSR
jgi:hypothetical protein